MRGRSLELGRTTNVRFWHKADIPTVFHDVRFRGQSGHRSDFEMSADDPERTWVSPHELMSAALPVC